MGAAGLSLEHAILGLLSERERSGYDLKTRCFDDEIRSLWTADQAQIYRTLDRLQAQGLVQARRKRQTGRPDRKLYSITEAGRAELLRWLVSPQPLPASRDAFLLHLYFSAPVDDESLTAVLRARRDGHQTRLETLRNEAAEGRRQPSETREKALRSMALNGAIARQRATIDWLDDCIERIDSHSLPPTALSQALPSEGA